MDIHGKIREVLAQTVRDDQGPSHRGLSEADFLHALQRRGIIDDVMKDLHFTQVAQHLTGNFQTYILNDTYNRSSFEFSEIAFFYLNMDNEFDLESIFSIV